MGTYNGRHRQARTDSAVADGDGTQKSEFPLSTYLVLATTVMIESKDQLHSMIVVSLCVGCFRLFVCFV